MPSASSALFEHEPALEGTSELDLLFTHDDGSSFLADITSVSDEGFEEKYFGQSVLR